jgi:hypothetical protein
MNKLQEKANELVALGESYGYAPEIDPSGNGEHYVYVFYNNSIGSLLSFTETGKVRVESWERGRKRTNISLTNLASHLQGYKETQKHFEELRKRNFGRALI